MEPNLDMRSHGVFNVHFPRVCVYACVCAHQYLGVGLLGHGVSTRSSVVDLAKQFLKVGVQFKPPPAVREPLWAHTLTTAVHFPLFHILLSDGWWYRLLLLFFSF